MFAGYGKFFAFFFLIFFGVMFGGLVLLLALVVPVGATVIVLGLFFAVIPPLGGVAFYVKMVYLRYKSRRCIGMSGWRTYGQNVFGYFIERDSTKGVPPQYIQGPLVEKLEQMTPHGAGTMLADGGTRTVQKQRKAILRKFKRGKLQYAAVEEELAALDRDMAQIDLIRKHAEEGMPRFHWYDYPYTGEEEGSMILGAPVPWEKLVKYNPGEIFVDDFPAKLGAIAYMDSVLIGLLQRRTVKEVGGLVPRIKQILTGAPKEQEGVEEIPIYLIFASDWHAYQIQQVFRDALISMLTRARTNKEDEKAEEIEDMIMDVKGVGEIIVLRDSAPYLRQLSMVEDEKADLEVLVARASIHGYMYSSEVAPEDQPPAEMQEPEPQESGFTKVLYLAAIGISVVIIGYLAYMAATGQLPPFQTTNATDTSETAAAAIRSLLGG